LKSLRDEASFNVYAVGNEFRLMSWPLRKRSSAEHETSFSFGRISSAFSSVITPSSPLLSISPPNPNDIRVDSLFPSEKIVLVVDKLQAFEATDSNSRTIPGRLMISNFRILFEGQLQGAFQKQLSVEISFPISTIDKSRVENVPSMCKLIISTKTFRLVHFIFEGLYEQFGYLIQNHLNSIRTLASIENVFAFDYRSGSLDFHRNLSSDRTPSTESSKLSIKEELAIRQWERFNEWRFYDPVIEYARMNLGDKWAFVDINQEFSFCESYPALCVVPLSVKTSHLIGSSNFRTKNRFPALVWKHPLSNTSLSRSSQPRVGLNGARSLDDEFVIESIRQTNPQSSWLYIIDARPKANAIGNQMMGSGYERNYENCKMQFMGIENIHDIRKSYKKLFHLILSSIADDSNWLSGLEQTGLFKHIQSILQASVEIVDILIRKQSSVMIHCSDGWDRTPQLLSLSQLMLDPYYRTIEGFIVLLEKDWMSFGHRFAARCFGWLETKEYRRKEMSPVFLLFIDCVYQLKRQFPMAFQFNVKFLVLLVDSIYEGRFGNFLYNCEKQRFQAALHERTYSLWESLLNTGSEFASPSSSLLSSDNDRPNLRKDSSGGDSELALEHFIDPLFRNESLPILPSCSLKKLKFFEELYIRWDFKLRNKEDLENRILELAKTSANLKIEIRRLSRNKSVQDTNSSGNNDDNNNKSKLLPIHKPMSSEFSHMKAQVYAAYAIEHILGQVFNEISQKSLLPLVESREQMLLKRLESFQLPKWMPDDSTSQCHACNATFTLLNRKHHCRGCGEIFCAGCTRTQLPLPQLNLNGPQRLCDRCKRNLLAVYGNE